MIADDDPLPLQIVFATEVDEVADRLTGDTQVVEELSFVLGYHVRYCFQFHHNRVVNEKVRLVKG